MSRYTGPRGHSNFKQLAQWRQLTPEQQAARLPCPECGTTGERWTDSWEQERCERCWAIVAAKETAA
jgi:predicted RNA-binding Zn-ribbon protein involved in translation (DUF1610 family)